MGKRADGKREGVRSGSASFKTKWIRIISLYILPTQGGG